MNSAELLLKMLDLRQIESNFDKGYAGAPLFCEAKDIGPEELLKVIAFDRTKEDSDVEFNNGAEVWCREQLAGSN